MIDNSTLKRTFYSQFTESKHSEHETDLWKERQTALLLLNSAKTKIRQMRAEKKKFMETLKESAVSRLQYINPYKTLFLKYL